MRARLTSRHRIPFVVCCLLLLLTGCSGGRGGYPEVTVKSPLNKPAKCHSCEKEIASVEEKNVLQIGGAQYVICSEECAAEMKEWHKSQFGQ